jgi:hypothetical protein
LATKADDLATGTPAAARGEFSLGWKVLVAGIIGVACGASPIPFNVIGFTIAPLTQEFGWTKTEILTPITIFGVVAALLAPVFGWLADTYGVRRTALWSLFGFGVTFAALSLTPPVLWAYYALWLMVGLVGIGSTPVTWSRAINMWFYKSPRPRARPVAAGHEPGCAHRSQDRGLGDRGPWLARDVRHRRHAAAARRTAFVRLAVSRAPARRAAARHQDRQRARSLASLWARRCATIAFG